jgi:hypothetical protein
MQIRKQLVRNTGILMALGMLLSPMAADARQGAGNGNKGSQAGLSSIIAQLPKEDLSTEEEDGLMLMREEEKLARDVYLTLHGKWGLAIFGNIALAEQRHMTAVKSLLVKYGLTDPVAGFEGGLFPTTEMQDLYDSKVAEGSESLVDALYVGATIEDLDIFDLYELLSETDNLDIQIVYQNLAKGSRNHLRAFVSQLDSYDVIYEAQYLTSGEIDEILSTPWERGRVDEDGEPVTGGNMGGGQGGRQ